MPAKCPGSTAGGALLAQLSQLSLPHTAPPRRRPQARQGLSQSAPGHLHPALAPGDPPWCQSPGLSRAQFRSKGGNPIPDAWSSSPPHWAVRAPSSGSSSAPAGRPLGMTQHPEPRRREGKDPWYSQLQDGGPEAFIFDRTMHARKPRCIWNNITRKIFT